MIDGHGDDLWRYGGRIKHNFSTNIHAAFDHRPLMAHLAADTSAIDSYPEPEPRSVEKALGALHGIDPSAVMVTNGATEAIYLLARAFTGARSAIVAPTFREYQDAALANDHIITFIPDLDNLPLSMDMVWLCNPNNPTGSVIPRVDLLRIIDGHPSMTFIIDQAYADYTAEPVVATEDISSRSNVIVLSSLTKRFAIPGLRIGYAIGPVKLLGKVKRFRLPWSVNGPAIKAALYLLEHISDYPIASTGLNSEALRIKAAFEELGIGVSLTDCNFILCRLPRGSAAGLKEALVGSAGILIRDASNFEGLGPEYFRVAAQTAAENDLLISEVKRWLDS